MEPTKSVNYVVYVATYCKIFSFAVRLYNSYEFFYITAQIKKELNYTRPKGVENDASARPPTLSSASCDLDL